MSSSSSGSPIFQYFKKTKRYEPVTNSNRKKSEELENSENGSGDSESFWKTIQKIIDKNESNKFKTASLNVPNSSTSNNVEEIRSEDDIDQLISQICSHSPNKNLNDGKAESSDGFESFWNTVQEISGKNESNELKNADLNVQNSATSNNVERILSEDDIHQLISQICSQSPNKNVNDGKAESSDGCESFWNIVQEISSKNESNKFKNADLNVPNSTMGNNVERIRSEDKIDQLISKIRSHSPNKNVNDGKAESYSVEKISNKDNINQVLSQILSPSPCSNDGQASLDIFLNTIFKENFPERTYKNSLPRESSDDSFKELMTFLTDNKSGIDQSEKIERSDCKNILEQIISSLENQPTATNDREEHVVDSSCKNNSENSKIISQQISKDNELSNLLSSLGGSNIMSENANFVEPDYLKENVAEDVFSIPFVFLDENKNSPKKSKSSEFVVEVNSNNLIETIVDISSQMEPLTKMKRKRKNDVKSSTIKLNNIVEVLFDSQTRAPCTDLTNINSENRRVGRIRSKDIEKIGTENWLSYVVNQSCDEIKEKVPVRLISANSESFSEETTEPYIKRYRKGKTKIFRIKTTRTREKEQDMDINTIIQKLTQTSESSNGKDEETDSFKSLPESYESDETERKSIALSTGSGQLSDAECKLRSAFNRISKDKSLIYHNGEDKIILKNLKKDEIKMRIKDLFLKVFEAFCEGRSPCFSLRAATFENCTMKDGILAMKSFDENLIMSNVNYLNSSSRTKFCIMLYIMGKVYSLLEHSTKLTKRSMFYQIKHIIKSQSKLDSAVNAISNLLNVGQWDLNIISHCGLVYGNLKLVFSTGEVTNCNVAGTMIPYELNSISEIQSNCHFILVVEKESIFCKLIGENLPNKLTRPFIMITGKGFPDLNTQLFLKRLWTILSVPVFILVDADPHGIQIMITYRFGSLTNSHLSHYLAVPNARWLGVFPSEIMRLGMKSSDLNQKEEKMVSRLIESPYVINHPQIKEELKVLMTSKKKAAIEGLMHNDKYLGSAYLPSKFFTQDYI